MTPREAAGGAVRHCVLAAWQQVYQSQVASPELRDQKGFAESSREVHSHALLSAGVSEWAVRIIENQLEEAQHYEGVHRRHARIARNPQSGSDGFFYFYLQDRVPTMYDVSTMAPSEPSGPSEEVETRPVFLHPWMHERHGLVWDPRWLLPGAFLQ